MANAAPHTKRKPQEVEPKLAGLELQECDHRRPLPAQFAQSAPWNLVSGSVLGTRWGEEMEKCSLWPVRQRGTREGTKHPACLGCAGFSLACLLIPWACLCVRDAPEQFMLELGGAFPPPRSINLSKLSASLMFFPLENRRCGFEPLYRGPRRETEVPHVCFDVFAIRRCNPSDADRSAQPGGKTYFRLFCPVTRFSDAVNTGWNGGSR